MHIISVKFSCNYRVDLNGESSLFLVPFDVIWVNWIVSLLLEIAVSALMHNHTFFFGGPLVKHDYSSHWNHWLKLLLVLVNSREQTGSPVWLFRLLARRGIVGAILRVIVLSDRNVFLWVTSILNFWSRRVLPFRTGNWDLVCNLGLWTNIVSLGHLSQVEFIFFLRDDRFGYFRHHVLVCYVFFKASSLFDLWVTLYGQVLGMCVGSTHLALYMRVFELGEWIRHAAIVFHVVWKGGRLLVVIWLHWLEVFCRILLRNWSRMLRLLFLIVPISWRSLRSIVIFIQKVSWWIVAVWTHTTLKSLLGDTSSTHWLVVVPCYSVRRLAKQFVVGALVVQARATCLT